MDVGISSPGGRVVAALAYNHHELLGMLGLLAAGLLVGGASLITAEHHRVLRVERQWLADHPDRAQSSRHAV